MARQSELKGQLKGWTVELTRDGRLELSEGMGPRHGGVLVAWTQGSKRDGLNLLADEQAQREGAVTAAQTFLEWRQAHAPRLRRTGPTAITHSGQSRTVLGCLCGDWHSYATRWPVPAHARMWRAGHDYTCLPPGVARETA